MKNLRSNLFIHVKRIGCKVHITEANVCDFIAGLRSTLELMGPYLHRRKTRRHHRMMSKLPHDDDQVKRSGINDIRHH
jgi:hypothetical protein